jgi:thiamine-monophosphate kinase
VTTLDEFSLIARYFTRPSGERQGVGDDCALIDVGDRTLAITSDMLLEDVHFLPEADARDLGHKALAVNLSDLAAAGAQPRCFLLDLALPQADEDWLDAFSQGLFALAQEHACALVGGDTTRAPVLGPRRGPLTIAITAIGTIEREHCRGRDGARAGDDIWVSGALGEAALALAIRRGQVTVPAAVRDECFRRMDRPTPRIALGRALRGLASAAIDVSDGLIGDLGHILERSGVGAQVLWEDVPCAGIFRSLGIALHQKCVLAGGDDYELLFTAPVAHRTGIAALAGAGVPLTRIGTIESAPGLRLRNGDGTPIETTLHSFDHFL